MYISLAELKTYLGITGASEDARLTQCLNSSRATIVSVLGDYSTGDKSYLVHVCNVKNSEIVLPTFNITALKKIDDVAYAGVLGTDYRILPPNNTRLYIPDYSTYYAGNKYIKFTVTAGYGTIPEDLKNLQYMLASLDYSKEDGKGIKSYTLGPRSFQFEDSETAQQAIDSINNIIGRYTPLVTI